MFVTYECFKVRPLTAARAPDATNWCGVEVFGPKTMFVAHVSRADVPDGPRQTFLVASMEMLLDLHLSDEVILHGGDVLRISSFDESRQLFGRIKRVLAWTDIEAGCEKFAIETSDNRRLTLPTDFEVPAKVAPECVVLDFSHSMD